MKFLLTTLLALCFTSAQAADNWPQWRGPRADGVAADGRYPIEFSAEENVAWKIELPGLGASTPAVWDDRIFVTCGVSNTNQSDTNRSDAVVCYDLDGNEQWRKTFGIERAAKHRFASGSNSSPITDGTHLIVYYKSGTVACLDFQGKVLWRHNLQDRYGADTLWWDLGTSPVLAAGNVVIAVMQNENSFLVAFHLATGEVAWKQDRNYETAKESDNSYTTPYVAKVGAHEEIVTWGADHLTGHDARSGELLWECGGFNPDNEGMWRVIASAAVDNEIAIVPYGRGDFLAAVRIGGEGDVTSSHRLWEKNGIGADVPTPAITEDQVFVLTDRGEVVCLDKSTGDEIWRGKFPRGRDKYFASPIMAGDLLYCARADGVVMVAQINEGLTLLAENDMGETLIATLVPIRNQLLIRGEKHLFLIR